MNLYKQLYSAYKDGETPAIRNSARLELNKVFGGTPTVRGYLNNDYTLRSMTGTDTPSMELAKANDDESNYLSWQNLYKRSIQALGNPVTVMSTASIESLNKQKSDHAYLESTNGTMWKNYVDDRTKIYRQIKEDNKSTLIPGTIIKYSQAADIANSSFTLDQFVQKFKAAYSQHAPDMDLTEDATLAYEELVKEFNARYDVNKDKLGLHSLSPSWSSEGGGAIGARPMVATFDGANQSGREDVKSIKADIDNQSTIAIGGAFVPQTADTELSDLVHDPAAKAAANFFLEAYLKGGWTKSKENSENRPIFKVTYNNVVGAGGEDARDSGMEAITLHFDENSAIKNRGTETKPSSTDWLFREGVFNPDVTLYVNKATAQNIMHANMEYTVDDYNLQSGGTITLDGYKNYGGLVRINKKNNQLVASGTLNWIDDQGTVRTTHLPEQVATTSNVSEFKKTIYNDILGVLNDKNIENQISAYNVQKKAFTKEQMDIILQSYGK
jgi:hypothetical protein